MPGRATPARVAKRPDAGPYLPLLRHLAPRLGEQGRAATAGLSEFGALEWFIENIGAVLDAAATELDDVRDDARRPDRPT